MLRKLTSTKFAGKKPWCPEFSPMYQFSSTFWMSTTKSPFFKLRSLDSCKNNKVWFRRTTNSTDNQSKTMGRKHRSVGRICLDIKNTASFWKQDKVLQISVLWNYKTAIKQIITVLKINQDLSLAIIVSRPRFSWIPASSLQVRTFFQHFGHSVSIIKFSHFMLLS